MDDHSLLDLYMNQSEDFRNTYSFPEFLLAVYFFRRTYSALKKVILCADAHGADPGF